MSAVEVGTVIRRDTELLSQAQSVFGPDLVMDAFVCAWADVNQRIRKESDVSAELSRQAYGSGTRGTLDFGGNTIRLLFANGRVVEFTASEWADVRLVTDTPRLG